MINFDKELEKFKPILSVNHVEEQITKEDMADMIDVLKMLGQDIYNEVSVLKETKDGE